MNRHDLTPAQYNALNARLRPMLGYLHMLETRMEQEGFPSDDEISRLDRRTGLLHDLTVKVQLGRLAALPIIAKSVEMERVTGTDGDARAIAPAFAPKTHTAGPLLSTTVKMAADAVDASAARRKC